MDRSNPPPRGPKIVVGVDGSAEARPALAWALAEAARRQVGCLVVKVVTPLEALAASLPPADQWPGDVLGRADAELLERLRQFDDLVQAAPQPIDIEARIGAPGPLLVEAARGAGLLVVGSHGRSRAEQFVLGSVSRYVIEHASCPVVVLGPRLAVAGTAVAPVANPARRA